MPRPGSVAAVSGRDGGGGGVSDDSQQQQQLQLPPVAGAAAGAPVSQPSDAPAAGGAMAAPSSSLVGEVPSCRESCGGAGSADGGGAVIAGGGCKGSPPPPPPPHDEEEQEGRRLQGINSDAGDDGPAIPSAAGVAASLSVGVPSSGDDHGGGEILSSGQERLPAPSEAEAAVAGGKRVGARATAVDTVPTQGVRDSKSDGDGVVSMEVHEENGGEDASGARFDFLVYGKDFANPDL